MAEDRPYLEYPFRSPRMDQSVPPNQVRPGSFGRLSGVDGRFKGGLRKYFGNKKVVDLDTVTNLGGIDAYNGPDFFKQVTFQRRGTSSIYRGFVIRWDSQNDTDDEQIDLVYTINNGTTWTALAIWAAGNTVTSALEIDCAIEGEFLIVAVDTKSPKTVYWNGASLVAVDSGPGYFATELTTMTESSTSVDTDYYLNGAGTYQIAWRFYDATRGIFSSLSAPVTIHMDHYRKTKATATVNFSSSGGDSGLFVDGDVITINSREYEADDNSSYAGDVQVDISGLTTIAQHAQALVDAINGDASAEVTASAQTTSVLLEALERGSGGNALTLTKTESGANADDISVSGATLAGGGFDTDSAEEQCKAVLDLPNNTAVVTDKAYTNFNALFDTVDIFRTINLGNASATNGAIFYLEQTIAKTGNWATSGAWDTLQVTIGTVVDTALPFCTMYNPETDIVTAPPQSGTIGRYEDQTYMAQTASVDGGYATLFSSPEHASPEYFSTYNKRVGVPEDGKPLRFLPAGESLFQLCHNAVVHIYKSGKLQPIRFARLHTKRGLVGKEAGHSSGNSVFMVSGVGLVILNASDGSMGAVSSADRVIFDDWKSYLTGIKSGYDSLMNASFFLCPDTDEMLILWHSTQVCTMLDGVNFVGVTDGPDISSGEHDRVYFITKTGLIVSPDNLQSGSGTAWDISDSYTLNGTATATGSTLSDENATFHADMIGTLVYMTTGENAGLGREVASLTSTEITFSTSFPNDIATGDTYAVSPVPFSLRAWAMQNEKVSRFMRWISTGVSLKSRALSGFSENVNNVWRVGMYRNGGTTLQTSLAYPSVDEDPHDSAEALNLHGVDLEPYIEQISSGTSFELTDAEFSLRLSDSRKDSGD